MPWVKEFSGNSIVASHSNVVITVPAGGLAAGNLVVIGLVAATLALPGVSVTDSVGGNTWAVPQQRQEGTSGSAHQISSKLTNALPAGATITVTFTGQTSSRTAWSGHEFNDTTSGLDTGNTGAAGGVTGHPATANFTTTQANTLIVGVINMISAGRVYTPNATYTAGTKVATAAGSGDRAVVVQWKYVSSIGSYLVNGTFNSSALWSATGQAYKIGSAPPSAGGTMRRWNGTAFKTGGTFKRWDGTQFKTGGTLRRWDGTKFIPSP